MFNLVALLDSLPGNNADIFDIVDLTGGNFELRIDTDNNGDFDYLLATVQVAVGSTFDAADVTAV